MAATPRPNARSEGAASAELLPRLRVGLAGWSYPDWRGIFYPTSRPRGFSELRFAAEHFDVLEINSTFYRLPDAKMAGRWAETVDGLDDFVFTAKLTKDLTHGDLDAEDFRTRCRAYREGIAPLSEAGRLDAVLVQFPFWFDDSTANRQRLERIAGELGDLSLVVEVRHRSWIDGSADAGLPFIERLGIDFANIDLPRAGDTSPATCITTGGIGYYRLHGRNAKAWFTPKAGRDAKYDWLYGLEELRELLPTFLKILARTQQTYLIANNHYRGQAPANAFQLIHLMSGQRPRVPETMQMEFPFLRGE